MHRLWLVLVVALFGLPLFINLDGQDLRGDEAGHSYSVDRILETGDWLIPRNSPSDNPFVEKPPLKFWLVAAPIAMGLLPDNEFSMRIWDALFGALAFLYVFRIGARLASPLCGAAAVLILFIHWPLLFDHGLRGNNMEAALLLSYCGGIYHYLVWATEKAPDKRHPIAVGLFFALGFMVKFVAALFLPMVIGVATLALADSRGRLLKDWRIWLGASLLSLALIAPWFIYGNHLFGQGFWHIILGDQVYVRLTVGLDPTHVHPWHFYFSQLFRWLKLSKSDVLAGLGAALLLIECIRRPSIDRLVVLIWFALPFTAISFGTSKLYHYAYPFLPPVALAGGYILDAAWRYGQPAVVAWVAERERTGGWPARLHIPPERQALRMTLAAIAAVAGGLFIWTVLFGSVRIGFGNVTLFKSGSLFRPWMAAVVLGIVAGRMLTVGRLLVIPAIILAVLPTKDYRETIAREQENNHPFRTVTSCIRDVRATTASPMGHSLYEAGPDSAFGHQHNWYFRKLGMTERAMTPSAQTVHKYLFDPHQQEPVLIDASWYNAREWPDANKAVKSTRLDDALLLLPGAYGACAGK